MSDPESADDRALRGAKTMLRQAVGRRRHARSAAQREADDHDRFDRIAAELRSHPVRTVACYVSVPPEPGTLQLIAWLAAQDVDTLLPVLPETGSVTSAPPDWARYTGPGGLATGRWGLIQPTGPRLGAAAVAAAELIFVPGLAADEHGARLGRGGGWYDRAVGHARAETPLVILLNDDEVLEAIPAQSWDVPVDVVVTPTHWRNCS